MSTDERDFITNTLRVCQDIQNRFYSERIKVGDVDPEEPWWLSKVSLLAFNAELFVSGKSTDALWPKDFDKAAEAPAEQLLEGIKGCNDG